MEHGACLKPWRGRLPDFGLVQSSGRTAGTRYFVTPDLLRGAALDQVTTLKRIEPHRLMALILEDLARYPNSKIGEIHRRIAPEVGRSQIKRTMAELTARGEVVMEGERNTARYWLKTPPIALGLLDK